MNQSKRPKVLVSCPAWSPNIIYLPYLYGSLRAYAEQDLRLKKFIIWQRPVFECLSAEEIYDQIKLDMPDIVGLSCYEWNFEVQIKLAEQIKEAKPDTLVVAGGPHPDWKDPKGFMNDHPFFDIVVVKDGEYPFKQILSAFLETRSFEEIPGLILRDGSLTQSSKNIPLNALPSPYILFRKEYEQYIEMLKKRNQLVHVMWETNRGCPYACSFCDWGSNTMSKIRRYCDERLYAEAKWFAQMQIDNIFITDANFGIFPQDEELIDQLCHLRKEYGAPKKVMTNTAKNNAKRVASIGRKLYESKMMQNVCISFQHTRPEVLKSIDRNNIRTSKLLETMEFYYAERVPVTAVLICGNPGDTLWLWKLAWNDLLNWGFHDDIQTHNFQILPNAPAAQKEYIDLFSIQTIRRRSPRGRILKKDVNKSRHESWSDFVVKTNTLSLDDWVECQVFQTLIKAFHNLALTRWISHCLKWELNITYQAFYESLYEKCQDSRVLKGLFDSLKSHFYEYLHNNDALLLMAHDEIDQLLHPDEWLFINAVTRPNDFYHDVHHSLLRLSQNAQWLSDLCSFNRQIIIDPYYQVSSGRIIDCKYNWPAYFASHGSQNIKKEGFKKHVRQSMCGIFLHRPIDTTNLNSYALNMVRQHHQRHQMTYFASALSTSSEQANEQKESASQQLTGNN